MKPAASLAPLSKAQFALLLRLAKGPHACRGYDALPIAHLVERALAREDGRGRHEITPAGRHFIASDGGRHVDAGDCGGGARPVTPLDH
jgi:hypothetical protein